MTDSIIKKEGGVNPNKKSHLNSRTNHKINVILVCDHCVRGFDCTRGPNIKSSQYIICKIYPWYIQLLHYI